MTRSRLALVCATTLLSTFAASRQLPIAFAQEKPAAAPSADSKPQSELASKTAKFATVSAKTPALHFALDAKDLAGAKTRADHDGAFVGTVSKVYTPKGNKLVVLDFAADYKTAMTAAIKSESFAKFPDLKTLEGKKVLVTGKIVAFRESYEIDVTDLSQIKIVQ